MALRTPLSVTPHLYMGDSTGRPLDKGVVYFGEQDKDPEFYPIDLFSDDALTLPLAQPVHTKGGYLYDKGDMVEPHAKELIYSVKVLDTYGRKVFYKGAMMRNSWNDDVIEQINTALVSTAEEAAQIATDVAKEIADKAVISSGFVTIDSFELGATLTQRNQALRHAADGRLYRWAGDLPKVVPAISTPTSTGGFGSNAWLEVSDQALRSEINNGLITDTIVLTAPKFSGASARDQSSLNAESVSVFDLDATGDGVTDDSSLLTNLNTQKVIAKVPYTEQGYYMPRGLLDKTLHSNTGLIGVNGRPIFTNDTNDSNGLSVRDNGVVRATDVTIKDLKIVYTGIGETGSSHLDNTFPALRASADKSIFENLEIESGIMTGMSSGFGSASLATQAGSPTGADWVSQSERQVRDSTFANIKVKNGAMAFEFFSSLGHKILGNSANNTGVGVASHGYRLTGYQGMPSKFNAFFGNSSFDYLTGYSIQAAAQCNTINGGISVGAKAVGLQLLNIAFDDINCRSNYFQGILSDNKAIAVDAQKSIFSRYDMIIDGVDGTASAVNFRSLGEGNIVDAIVTKTAGEAIKTSDSNSMYRLVVDAALSTGATIAGSNNIVDIIVIDSGYIGVAISGNNNIVRVIKSGTSSTVDVQVTGSSNNITANCRNLNFIGAAAKNKLSGNIAELGGVVNNNNVSDVVGVTSQKRHTLTTSDIGEVVVLVENVPKGVTLMGQINVISDGTVANVKSIARLADGSCEVTCLFRDYAGAVKSLSSVDFNLLLSA